jgi:hypothetical protein
MIAAGSADDHLNSFRVRQTLTKSVSPIRRFKVGIIELRLDLRMKSETGIRHDPES